MSGSTIGFIVIGLSYSMKGGNILLKINKLIKNKKPGILSTHLREVDV